jgi:hypothetical protein
LSEEAIAVRGREQDRHVEVLGPATSAALEVVEAGDGAVPEAAEVRRREDTGDGLRMRR